MIEKMSFGFVFVYSFNLLFVWMSTTFYTITCLCLSKCLHGLWALLSDYRFLFIMPRGQHMIKHSHIHKQTYIYRQACGASHKSIFNHIRIRRHKEQRKNSGILLILSHQHLLYEHRPYSERRTLHMGISFQICQGL